MQRPLPPSAKGSQIYPPPQEHASVFDEASHSGVRHLYPPSATPNIPPHPPTTPSLLHENSHEPQALRHLVSPVPQSRVLAYVEGTSLEAAHDPHLRQSNMLYIKNIKYFKNNKNILIF